MADLATTLLESGVCWPTVLCREEGALVTRLKRVGVPTRVVAYPARFRTAGVLPRFSPLSFNAARRWIRAREIDVVHVNGPFALLYAGLAARWQGVPVVFTSHLPEDTGSRFKRLLITHLADRVLAVSDALAARVTRAGVDASKVRTVPLGVNVQSMSYDNPAGRAVRESLGWTDGDVVVCGAVGRIQRVKAQLRFIEAIQRARLQTPSLRGLIVGSPWPGDSDARRYQEEIAQALTAPDLAGAVVQLPHTDDMRGVFSALDMLVIPSDSESFGRVALEAMACSRPVVSTPCGGPQRLIAHGESGIVAEKINAQSLADAINRLADSAKARAAMGERGRLRATQEFSLRRQVERVIAVYRELFDAPDSDGNKSSAR